MAIYRQKDCAKHLHYRRAVTAEIVLKDLTRRRLRSRSRCRRQPASTLLFAAHNYLCAKQALSLRTLRVLRIASIEFDSRFERLSEQECLEQFRFSKGAVIKLVPHLGLQTPHTKRNAYSTTPLSSCCLLLRRLASPCRWADVTDVFGKQPSHMSEIYWEALEQVVERYGDLIKGSIPEQFLQQRAANYAAAVADKTGALQNCVGFIDGTRIAIARPTGSVMQNVAYNGHKRLHCFKFQTVTTPDGFCLHAFGPTEGRRHDWFLYTASGIESLLDELLFIDGTQYCIYGDSGYNSRSFLEVPFQGTTLTSGQSAFNRAMSAARVTVEWHYKELKQYWTTVDFKRKMKVGEGPVGAVYLACLILTNLRNCLHPNPVSHYFACSPLTLEEYLSLRSE